MATGRDYPDRRWIGPGGGGTGIRTQETPKGPAAFKAAPFVRSGIPPAECTG